MYRLLLFPLLPYVTRWIAAQERRILAEGTPLSERSLADARRIGVLHPERVRLLSVPQVPQPGGAFIAFLGRCVGMPSENTAGLTARYGIFIRANQWGDRRLLAHELAHTAQYERLGGLRPFLRQYLMECLTTGYGGAPLELEAIEAEAIVCSNPRTPLP
ncbi:MAG TPA: hypothetical protein VGO11_14195 [Chthoniobacteraceae bacterium]|jgi:hypothetical protein|nr:hypothetical protein [Chthoniobacteraceae bacterium]